MFFKRILIILFFAFSLSLLVAMNVWKSAEFSGIVVDEGGRPVKGAIVLIGWRLQPFSKTIEIPFYLTDVITDERGRFVVKKWGPILSPNFMASVSANEPMISVIHPEYRPLLRKWNPDSTGERLLFNVTPAKISAIQLKNPHEVWADRQREMESFDASLHETFQWSAPHCFWSGASTFVKRMRQIEQDFKLSRRFILLIKLC